MKNAQLKTITTLMLILLLGAISVYALTVTLNSPDATWETSGSTNFNFTPSGEINPLTWCAIYTNATGTWQSDANYSNVANGTPFVRGIGLGDSGGLGWIWNAVCYNGSDEIFDTANNTFGVDSTLPSISLDSPTNGEYITTSENLSFVPTDASNPEDCDVYTNMGGSWIINNTFDSFTSGSTYGVNITDLADGSYDWNVKCNQTSTDSVWAETGGNYSFVLDTTDPTDIKMVSPTNGTVSATAIPEIKWNKTTEINFDRYYVYVSSDITDLEGSAVQSIQVTNISENATTLVNALPTDTQYYIWVKAVDLAGNSKNVSGANEYYVDSTSPVLTLGSPTNGTYTSDTQPDFNISVVDDNPDACRLYLSNSSGEAMGINISITDVVNGTVYNMTPSIMVEGTYKFNIGCNDSKGTEVNVSSTSLDLTVDTTAPTAPELTITFGQTNSTDTTPSVSWKITTETNFEKYIVEAYNSSYDLSGQINITNKSTTSVDMDSLETDETYTFNVTAYDLAENVGRDGNTTLQSLYYIDPVCGTLYAGWNLCGAVSTTNRNLSVIGAETSATMLTVWNSSHEWQTCVYGVASTNCDVEVGVNGTHYNAVWVYVAAETAWEDRTWSAEATSANITVTNTTVGWNLFGMFVRNGRTFSQLNTTAELTPAHNISSYSLRYNNGSSSVPYIAIANFTSYNSETKVRYGEALWVYYTNATSYVFDVGGW